MMDGGMDRMIEIEMKSSMTILFYFSVNIRSSRSMYYSCGIIAHPSVPGYHDSSSCCYFPVIPGNDYVPVPFFES